MIEVATGMVACKKIFFFILKNKIKNVVYQASLSSRAELVEWSDLVLSDDEAKLVELKICVLKRMMERLVGTK